MPKIVHLCLSGPFTDGWNYQENLITKYQHKNGHHVTVITSQWVWKNDGQLGKTNLYDYVNADGVRVIRLPIRGKKSFNYKFKKFEGVYEALETCAPDILFIHGVSYLDIKTAAIFLKKHPQVVAYADNHGDLTNSGTNWVSKNILHGIIWKHYANLLVPYVRKFYGVLPIRVDFLVDIYKLPKEKCELLVMGADDELVTAAKNPKVKREIRNKYGIAEDDFLIITGGKIDQWKTQTLLLMEAVQNIKNKKVKLIVFGSVVPELKERINELADGEKVQYIGWILAQDTYQYFAAADLVVFPGRHSVFWEQVASQGIPMLCKDLPGTHHVDVGGNIKFLSEETPASIQKEIENLINRPDVYKKMKLVASEKGANIFSYQEISKRAIEE